MSQIKLIAFGDSLTAGNILREGEKNWTELLAEALFIEVKNSGIGGNTSAQGLARMEQDVLSYSPDVVLICFGMNDHIITDGSGKTMVSEEVFAANLTEMITRTRAIGGIPVLITPNTVIEEYYYTRHPHKWYAAVGGANAQLERYCEIIRWTAMQMNVPLIDIFLESKKRELSELLRTLDHGGVKDGVHPYGEGIHFYANTIMPEVRAVVIQANRKKAES